MVFSTSCRRAAALLCASLFIGVPLIRAHNWIDCFDHDRNVVYDDSDVWVLGGNKGHGACEGYGYNYPGRGDPDINTKYTYLISREDVINDVPICQYTSSDVDYSGWRTVLNAQPGDKIYYAYLPNGHVVKDKSGLDTRQGIYWSGKSDVQLISYSDIVDGNLVDGSLAPYDDGNCGETYEDGDFNGGMIPSGRAGDYKPCVGTFVIPENTASGTYPMVWWWDMFTYDDEENIISGAAFSTCFDVVITDAGNDPATPTSPSTDGNEPPSNLIQNPTPSPGSTTPSPTISSPPSASGDNPTSPPPSDVSFTPITTPTQAPVPSDPPAPPSTSPPPAPTSALLPAPIVSDEPLGAVRYTSVGGTGSYGLVTTIECVPEDECIQADYPVQGPLVPFDEDLTLALRGPMDVEEISVFTLGENEWNRASYYSSQQGQGTLENMVFLNNRGNDAISGTFTTCHGNSQSFATADGQTAAFQPTVFDGYLDDGVEVNVMSNTPCNEQCGASRGVAYEGWAGAYKIFMIKSRMPFGQGGIDMPAIWLLNGQVVRTAQYSCNCRGVGTDGRWQGGCGEVDIAEILSSGGTELTSTVFSFQGARGTENFTTRPVDSSSIYIALFHGDSGDDRGTITILSYDESALDLSVAPSPDQVQEWLDYANAQVLDFEN